MAKSDTSANKLEDAQDTARSGGEVDPSLRPMNIYEGYAKATRNSLVWSSLTILVAFGVAWPLKDGNEPDDLTLSWVAGGIAFPPIVVLVAFAITAAYMFFSWKRAAGRNVSGNISSAFEKARADAASELEGLNDQVKEAQAEIQEGIEAFNRAKGQAFAPDPDEPWLVKALEKHFEGIQPELHKIFDALEVDVSLYPEGQGASVSQVDAFYRRKNSAFRNSLDNVMTDFTERLSSPRGELTKETRRIRAELTLAVSTLMTSTIEAIEGLDGRIEKFNKLYSNIAEREKQYDNYLIVLPVKSLAFIAVFATLSASVILFSRYSTAPDFVPPEDVERSVIQIQINPVLPAPAS